MDNFITNTNSPRQDLIHNNSIPHSDTESIELRHVRKNAEDTPNVLSLMKFEMTKNMSRQSIS
jgi:hypothetical protein